MKQIILTKANNTKETIREFVKGYKELLAEAKAMVISGEIVPYIPMSDIQPYWVELLEVRRLRKAKLDAVKRARVKFKDLAVFVKEHNLEYHKYNHYHHRVLNPSTKEFVDWWDGKKQLMQRVDMTYGVQGKKKIALMQQITKLA